MKYLKQFLIIMLFSLLGEICNRLLPWPIPASVYGMVFLFIALLTGIVKLSQVEDTAGFFLAIMPLFFVGPTVRLMKDYVAIYDQLLVFIIVCVASTIAALLCTGYAAQILIRIKKRRGEKDHD